MDPGPFYVPVFCLPLFQVIKNPIVNHLPTGCKKIGTSFKADEVVDIKTLVPDKEPVVFVIGAMAHGSVRRISWMFRNSHRVKMTLNYLHWALAKAYQRFLIYRPWKPGLKIIAVSSPDNECILMRLVWAISSAVTSTMQTSPFQVVWHRHPIEFLAQLPAILRERERETL